MYKARRQFGVRAWIELLEAKVVAMEFTGEYRIPAGQRQVWDALGDPVVLQACIAGCRQVEEVSGNEMVATVDITVGPISATFKGDVALTQLSAPMGYSLTAQGIGLARIEAQVSLCADRSDTVLKYLATVSMGPGMTTPSNPVLQTLSRMNADDFFGEFVRHVGGGRPITSLAWATEMAPSALPRAPEATPARWRWLRETGVVAACCLGFAAGYAFARWF